MCEACNQGKEDLDSWEKFMEIHKAKIINMNKTYAKSLKSALKHLETLSEKEDKDRLDYSVLITSMVTLMISSCKGWAKSCHVVKLDDMFSTPEELKKVADKMLKLIVEWINIDITVTETEIKKLTKNDKKSPSKKRKTKSTYVA